MRALFLNPPFGFKVSKESRWPEHTKSGTLYYPYWLAYAAGLMMQEGKHEVLLLDAIANGWTFEQTLKKIEDFNPGLVVMETATPTFTNDLKFAELLKKRKRCKICFVGTHVSALPEESLKASIAVDFVARREYDYTILNLANTIEKNRNLKNVLGMSYRKGKRIFHNPDRPLIKNLDALPFVSRVYKEFLDIHDYRYALARHPMIQVWSSRGCPNRCSFCLYPQTFSGRAFRARSPENFVAELEWIKENLPEVKEVFIEDDTFSVDKERVLKICKLMKDKNLNLVWSANARADIPYDVLKEMKDAGCRMLIIGYESGNQQILNSIKKGILIERAVSFTSDAKRVGIKIFGCFMIGLPGETRETIEQTFQFARKLNPDMVFFQQAVPFPGTEFYEWCKANGYLTTENFEKWLDSNGQLDYLVNYPNLTNEEIKSIRDRLVIRYYTSPRYIWQTLTHNMNLDEMKRLATVARDYLLYMVRKRVSA